MELIQAIALLCQVSGNNNFSNLNYQQLCHKHYLECVEQKYDAYAKRARSEDRLPTGSYDVAFLKKCIKEVAR